MPPSDTHSDAPKALQIGGRLVGPGQRTLIVAEAGVNHDGRVDAALRLVDAAVQAGADAVKFQMFRADDLATHDAPSAAYQKGQGPSGHAVGEAPTRPAGKPIPEATASQPPSMSNTQRAMLRRLELDDDAFARIRGHCTDQSILFLATPFGRGELARLVKLEPAAIKIASTDLTNTPLLRAAAVTGLPVILSTGAATPGEIDGAVDRLWPARKAGRLVLLHCVSCYPTPVEAINLRVIAVLSRRFGLPCGLSDHTTSTRVGGWAVAGGAYVLEKHLTLDRSAPGPDHAMSLSPGEFREYVLRVREVEAALGDGCIGMTAREAEVRAVAAKSIVAARDIPAGAVLTEDMLTLKRPGTGLTPSMLEQLLGRVAVSAIQGDTLLSWEMVR